MEIQVRKERAGDCAPIHRIIELAFRNASHSDHTEQFIVEVLRRSGALTISRVAESDGGVVGHVAISPVTISDRSGGWYGLGPIAVLPEYQGQSVGTKLMRGALADLEVTGASGCVVLGDPAYYRRFGFKVVRGLCYPGVPAEYFQAMSFDGHFPRGEVVYHEAFSAHG